MNFLLFILMMMLITCLPAAIALLATWPLIRRVPDRSLRALLRAMILGIFLAPTLAGSPGLHGALPVPAYWAIIFIVSGKMDAQYAPSIFYMFASMIVVGFIIWPIAYLIADQRNQRRLSSPRTKSMKEIQP